MNAFSVHVNQDDLALSTLSSHGPSTDGDLADRPAIAAGLDAAHHGARDARQAARGRSERDHARAGGGRSRSYAFRRS